MGDLLELSLDQPVDVVFSNAAFHWILDHDRLFERLFAALRPGGVLEAQCGGEGNVAEWTRAIEASEGDERFSPYLRGMQDTHYFASVGDTWSRLERAGFEVGRIWLEESVVEPREPRAFVHSVGLARHLATPAQGPSRGVRRRGLGIDAAPAGARLRAAQHLGPAARLMAARIVALPGDGVGPEIVAAARRVLDRLGEFEVVEHPVGGASIDLHGTPLTDAVLEACRGADAVLLGAVGGPKWDTTDPDAPRPEQGLLGLRKGLGLYANLRPVRPSPSLLLASPLRQERIRDTDLLVVRELTGGIYFGDRGAPATAPTTPASTRSPRSSELPASASIRRAAAAGG